MTTRGICYVANTSGYVKEALKSVSSLRDAMPDVAVSILAPKEFWHTESVSVQWHDVSFPRKGPIVKIAAINSPYDQTLFLDTDTFVAYDMGEIFDLLDAFDMALAHEATRGWDYPCLAPKAFCEFNTGVMLFKKCKAVAELFERWAIIYDEMFERYRINNDQASFREAAWLMRARIATLPSEYHLFPSFGAYVAWEAKILHGRGDLARIASEINDQVGPRTYNPTFGVLRTFTGMLSVAKNYLRITINCLGVVFKRRMVHVGQAPVAWHHERATSDAKS